MDPVNLYHLINDAYISCVCSPTIASPPSITLFLRRPGLTPEEIAKIRSRVVIFVGCDSAYRDIDLELLALLDRDDTSYIEVQYPPQQYLCLLIANRPRLVQGEGRSPHRGSSG